jgi:mannitol-1-/sugar-/sorbitol-6-phosphatase
MAPVLIAAEDVTRGKPAPDGYVLAASRLRVSPRDCLAFEDAHAGILAAKAAGASVLVITAARNEVFTGQDPVAWDFSLLRVTADENEALSFDPPR